MRAALFIIFLLLIPMASAVFDIQTCGVTVTSELFYIAHDLSDADTCLTIQADNAIIDGNGSTIYYAGSSQGHALVAQGRNNITIRNITIIQNSTTTNNSPAILLNANNVYLHDVTIFTHGTSNNSGIYTNVSSNITIERTTINTNGTAEGNSGFYMVGITSGKNVSIRNSVITTKGTTNNYGIYIDRANESSLMGNTISTNGSGGYNSGIYTYNSGNITIKNNVITTRGTVASMGIEVRSEDNALVENNTVTLFGTSTANYGLFFSSSSSHHIFSNTIFINESASGSAIQAQQASNMTFDNNTIFSGNKSGIVLYQSSYPSIGNETITNDDFVADIIISSSAMRAYNFSHPYLLFFYTSLGAIEFRESIAGFGDNLFGNTSAVVRIANNFASVNLSLDSSFNKSANVSLYSIGDRGFSNPSILKGGSACEECANFTSLTASSVSFNVTSWDGSYAIGEGASTPESSNSSPSPAGSSSQETSSHSSSSSYSPKTYGVSKEELQRGVVKEGLWKEDQLMFDFNGEKYFITLEDFDVLIDDAWVRLDVGAKEFTLHLNDEKEVNLWEDDKSDILIRLEEIGRNRVSLYLKIVEAQEVIEKEESIQPVNGSESPKVVPSKQGIFVVFSVLILLGAIVAFFIWKKKILV